MVLSDDDDGNVLAFPPEDYSFEHHVEGEWVMAFSSFDSSSWSCCLSTGHSC